MIRISIDDQMSELTDLKARNVEELLSKIDAEIPNNRIITEITIDGKYLNETLRETITTQIENVQVRTSDKAMWEANGIEISISSIKRLQTSLLRVSEKIQEGTPLHHDPFLSHCLEGVERFLEKLQITKQVLNLDFNNLDYKGLKLSQLESELKNILKSIDHFIEVQNNMEVSEKIEYELLTNLHLWTQALLKLQDSQNNTP